MFRFFFDLLYIHDVLQPEVVPFLQGIPGAIFQQDNASPHVAKIVRDFCSPQRMQLPLWPGYPPDMSSIESVFCSFKRGKIAAHTSSMEFSSASRHSKTVWFYATLCSNTHWSARWLHQILVSETYFIFLFVLKISSYICINTSRLCIKFHLIQVISSRCSIFYKQQHMCV